MKLVLDDIFDSELKDYLLKEEGINSVEIVNKDFISEIKINFNDKTSPLSIIKCIESFQNNEYSTLLSFDKGNIYKINQLNYLIEDMCCEYCYKSLIQELFKNNDIKSVKSNFEFNKPAFNIELRIEYNINCSEEEIVEYIKKYK